MSVDRINVGIKQNGKIYKVFSIYLMKDGSFKVDAPYCKHKKWLVARSSFDYGGGMHPAITVQEFSSNNRPQLSIHTSGFVQFSGKNINSGINPETGEIKGAGLHSNPLFAPISSGPTFGIQLWGIEEGFELSSKENECDIVYEKDDFIIKKIKPADKLNTFLIEGWVLPPNDRLAHMCMWKKQGKEKITLSFPRYIPCPGAVFTLDVIRLKNTSSFIALNPFITDTGFATDHPFGFLLGGPSEQSKDNPKKRISMNLICTDISTKELSPLDFIS